MRGKAAKTLRQEARSEIKPFLKEARLDVEAIQNDLIAQLCALPFMKRLRFCIGIMMGR